jgi:hypothetical protein
MNSLGPIHLQVVLDIGLFDLIEGKQTKKHQHKQ